MLGNLIKKVKSRQMPWTLLAFLPDIAERSLSPHGFNFEKIPNSASSFLAVARYSIEKLHCL